MLDKNLRIKSGSKVFYKVFRTTKEDLENKSIFSIVNGQSKNTQLEDLLKKVLQEKTSISDYEISQDFPVIGERTMLLNAREIVREEGGEKLILLVFGDITDRRMAEKSLEKSEIKFKLVAETIPQLIWITDPAGKFEYFNSQWRKYTGTSSVDSMEDKWVTFVHPHDVAGVLSHWHECMETGNPFSMEYRLKDRDGSYNWFLAKALPLFGTDGEIIKWFGSYTNIELQKEAEKALIKSSEYFRELAELLPEKITHADATGKVDYYNKSWTDYTGISRKELEDSGWIKVVHPDEKENVQGKLEACLKSGSNFEMEMRFLSKDGDYKWHLRRVIPVKDEAGRVRQWIGATTERIKEEEKRKEGFLQLVSHELKTPITSIKGYVQLLLTMLQQEPGLSPEALPLQPSLIRIDEQVGRLTRLISEMLDLSRIEENKLELKKEKFNLNELVVETVEDIKRTEIEHHIDVQHDFQCDVSADRDRIGQVIINLITNAIKYSPVHSDIMVRIFETDDGKAAVSITDRGIGIATGDQKEIFKRFHRVAGKNEETYAGLGIGLFLARDIIERHQGEMTVVSKLGEGSTFTFTLPIN